MIIYLGNANASDGVNAGSVSVTVVQPPEGASLAHVLADVAGLWPVHSDEPPSWVASDSAGLVALLTEQFQCSSITVEQAQAAYELPSQPVLSANEPLTPAD